MTPVTDESRKCHPWLLRFQQIAPTSNLVFMAPIIPPELVAHFRSRLGKKNTLRGCQSGQGRTLRGRQCCRSRMTLGRVIHGFSVSNKSPRLPSGRGYSTGTPSTSNRCMAWLAPTREGVSGRETLRNTSSRALAGTRGFRRTRASRSRSSSSTWT